MRRVKSCRVAAAFMAAAFLCGGCGTQAAQTPESPAQSEVSEEVAEDAPKSVEEVYKEIEQEVALESPLCMDGEFIENYYGIDTSVLEEYVFSMSEDAAQAETVIIMKVKEKDDMAGIAECLQTVVEEKKNEMENYIPEQFSIVEKSEVVEKDNCIWLVISENAEAITDIIESGLF